MAETTMMDNTEATETTEAPAKPKRPSVCDKVYLVPGEDGENADKRSADTKAVRLEFRFANKVTRTVELDDFNADVNLCATWHGYAQKLGDSYSGVKGNVDAAIEQFDAMYESLTGGEWVTTREATGPRVSILAEAVKRALLAEGQECDDERFKGIVAKLKDPDTRKRTAARDDVDAFYKQVQAERIAARAAEAMAKLEESEDVPEGESISDEF